MLIYIESLIAILSRSETLWDPVRADAAEKSGQDIESFLRGNISLMEREKRMSLLHSNDYNVAAAQKKYEGLRRSGWDSDLSWSRLDRLELERKLKKIEVKDFTLLAKEMNRSPGDCMVQYYRWKDSRKPEYGAMKKAWRYHFKDDNGNDYCKVCDDGGDTMVLCDRCDDAYHLGCLKPPLRAVPAGQWYCPRCVSKKNSEQGGVVSVFSQQCSSPSKLWSAPSRHSLFGKKSLTKDTEAKPRSTPESASRVVGGSSGSYPARCEPYDILDGIAAEIAEAPDV